MADRPRLAFFERYLSLWVALCMVAGVAIGQTFPGATNAVRELEFGAGSAEQPASATSPRPIAQVRGESWSMGAW